MAGGTRGQDQALPLREAALHPRALVGIVERQLLHPVQLPGAILHPGHKAFAVDGRDDLDAHIGLPARTDGNAGGTGPRRGGRLGRDAGHLLLEGPQQRGRRRLGDGRQHFLPAIDLESDVQPAFLFIQQQVGGLGRRGRSSTRSAAISRLLRRWQSQDSGQGGGGSGSKPMAGSATRPGSSKSSARAKSSRPIPKARTS